MSAASRPSSQVFALAQRTPRIALWGAASLVISGCAFNEPPPVDLQSQTHPLPATAIAVPQQQAQATGGLFQANRYRPPFESRRARLVGDMVTIQIAERVTATQLAHAAALLPAMLLGALLARPLARYVDSGRTRHAILLLAGASGLVLLVTSLAGL